MSSDFGSQSRDRPARVLLLAPTGRDAKVTADILTRARFICETCTDIKSLCQGIQEGAGLALLTAEALSQAGMREIAATLAGQPAWSDFPLLILVSPADADLATRSFEPLGPRAHITLIDRPIHVRTLLSTARAALRSRLRQYEIRDLVSELEARVRERDELIARERAHAERLAGLTEASLSIASALSRDDVLQLITDEAKKVLSADVAVTTMTETRNRSARQIRSSSSQSEHSEIAQLLSDAASRLLVSSPPSSTQTMRLALGDSNSAGAPLDRRLAGAIVAPLLERDGRTVGTIAIAVTPGKSFRPEDETVLTQLAHMASAAIQNARLYSEAQDANRAKDDFLATLAHELRTPMTGILGWIQMLKMEGYQAEDAATAIEMIESSTRVQARLVEDLLDVSRIIAGKLRIDYAPVELGPVVETVVELFRSRAEEAGLTLESQTEEVPLSVSGDETRLHQIIWNLLSNAIKFTPRGGRVAIELRQVDSEALIRVTDSGLGIAPEFLPHVFERFRQADNTTTRQQAGLGLGLAIVRHLVELHSGTVSVESEGPGKGTRFTIRLPVLAVRPERQDEAATDSPDLHGMKIIVVDDDPAAARLISSVLEGFGASVRSSTSVAAAVKMLRQSPADVIVSDIAMPGEDGYALMRRLRDLQPELGHEVRTVALTGYGRPDDRRRILSSGFQQYIQKPVQPVELARAIAALHHS